MGARPEDYDRAAPPHSYIHVDDFSSPKELAEYLTVLDKNDTLYNEYFRWKGAGEFINTYFWCRMCAMLHAPPYHKSYPDMHKWWAGAGTCNAGHWRTQATKTSTDIDQHCRHQGRQWVNEALVS
ncbi:glycoprotein 3-alpha-L-fucosyltransferase A [Caerostris extrusa]|uniref:Fucosyltransferase n=1 Tax=Caerostris extrusa TaxID=172846 RepID=A0AAV4PCG4_CAEEX|nr:glycoprotein 3-alpha-L-fucosyltransferase A [Caerostris extrusa]